MNNTENLLYQLQQASDDSFPNHSKYYARYITISEFLDRNVHPFVNQLAMIKDGGFLTDHGPSHIKTVIDRASELLQGYTLTPYEIYLLLVSIQLHDSGHIINGRKLHEKNAVEVMKELKTLMGEDTVERKQIMKIVDAHGGKVEGSLNDKDKIGKLEKTSILLNVKVRIQLLAAVLRFADELADDSRRAARYLFNNGKIQAGSEIYHAYALALHSVYINHDAKEVLLAFDINKDKAVKTFGKSIIKNEEEKIEQVYLLDEIFDRTIKMFTECLYCMRYFPSDLKIDSIKVKIEITDNEGLYDIHDPISYKLKQTGYPTMAIDKLPDMCSSELTFDGVMMSGEYLRRRLI